MKEISTQAKIRFIDCDPIGHLNNSKYIDYMLNAREDHVEMGYGYTYEQYTKETGCTWVTIQNEIAYLKEVRYNMLVNISSKVIEINDRTAKIEILMRNQTNEKIHAVLWCTVIYFNMKTRKSDLQPDDLKEQFKLYYEDLNDKNFNDRVLTLRKNNNNANRTH